MAKISFQDMEFTLEIDKIKVDFMKVFEFYIAVDELEKIGKVKVDKNSLIFEDTDPKKAENKFHRILNKSFTTLKNKITGNPALYIHKHSGIPLIGSLSFGIVDKGTDILELKPLTSCNLSCIFCSVDEGPHTKKCLDIVIEEDYLVQETKRILDFKKQPTNIYINPHGEPLLYADILELVKDLKQLEYVKTVSIITNGVLLNKELAEKLIKAGLDSLNISLNAISKKSASKLAGTSFDPCQLLELLPKLKDSVRITIAPVFLKGINEKDIEDIIDYCKKHDFELLIQNFLYNKKGRKPTKELPFEEFYSKLGEFEKEYDISLIQKGEMVKSNELPKPFKKGDIIHAEIIARGRYKDEFLAHSHNRIITAKGDTHKKRVKIKLTKDKYNIFYGSIIN